MNSRKLTLLMCLQASATVMSASLDIFVHLVMLSPCNFLQFDARANIVLSVISFTIEASKANRFPFPLIKPMTPESVSPTQFVKVNLSTLVQTAKATTLPSLTSSDKAARLSRLIIWWYAKYGSSSVRALQMDVCLSMFTQDGRCQSKSTAFRAHFFDTSIQWYKSLGRLNLPKMFMRSSAGRRSTGGQMLHSEFCSAMMFSEVGTPIED